MQKKILPILLFSFLFSFSNAYAQEKKTNPKISEKKVTLDKKSIKRINPKEAPVHKKAEEKQTPEVLPDSGNDRATTRKKKKTGK